MTGERTPLMIYRRTVYKPKRQPVGTIKNPIAKSLFFNFLYYYTILVFCEEDKLKERYTWLKPYARVYISSAPWGRGGGKVHAFWTT